MEQDDGFDLLLTEDMIVDEEFEKEISDIIKADEYDVYVYPDTVIYKRTFKDRFFSWPWKPWIKSVKFRHALYLGEDTPYIYIRELNRFICTASKLDDVREAVPQAILNIVRMPEEEL